MTMTLPLPRLSTILTVAALVTMATISGVYLWWAVLEPINPIVEVRESRVESEGPISRSSGGPILISRVYCSKREAWGEISAEFFTPANGGTHEGALRYTLASVPVHIEAGCHRRRRAWPVPPAMPPGEYVYIAIVQFCNVVGRCETYEAPAIEGLVIVP